MPAENVSLRDVDGTVPGRAALVSINLDDPDTTGTRYAYFVEGEFGCTNPIGDCHGLWESIKGDWPDDTHGIIPNERACYLNWRARCEAMGMENIEPQDYLEMRS
jgi:hypothetical protein